MRKTRKRCTHFKGKPIGPNKLHADGIKKMAIKGGEYQRRIMNGMKLPWKI
jgi:hypothetical protein